MTRSATEGAEEAGGAGGAEGADEAAGAGGARGPVPRTRLKARGGPREARERPGRGIEEPASPVWEEQPGVPGETETHAHESKRAEK